MITQKCRTMKGLCHLWRNFLKLFLLEQLYGEFVRGVNWRQVNDSWFSFDVENVEEVCIQARKRTGVDSTLCVSSLAGIRDDWWSVQKFVVWRSWQHYTVFLCGGQYYAVLLDISSYFQQWKNLENRLRFEKVIAKSLVASFLEHSVYAHVILCHFSK